MAAILEDQLIKLMKGEVDSCKIPGISILLRMDGWDKLFLTYGMADIEKKTSVERDTIFRLYSLTKPVIGAAIMKLMEEGKLDLGESVAEFLPGFRNQRTAQNGTIVSAARETKIADLLSMTAGIPSPGEASLPEHMVADIFQELEERRGTESEMSTVEFANRVGQCPLLSHPGTEYHYSVCADILGAVIEVVSGKSLPEFLKTEITDPLKMNDTGFWVSEKKQHRLAKIYEAVQEGGLQVYTDNFLGILNTMDKAPAFASGGAGLASTLDDYARFAQMLLNDGELDGVRILKPQTVKYFTTGCLNDEVQPTFVTVWPLLSGFSYGNLIRKCIRPEQAVTLARAGEYGWDGWTGMYFENFPNEKTTLLIGMQRANTGIIPFTRKVRNIVLSYI